MHIIPHFLSFFKTPFHIFTAFLQDVPLHPANLLTFSRKLTDLLHSPVIYTDFFQNPAIPPFVLSHSGLNLAFLQNISLHFIPAVFLCSDAPIC